MEKRGTAFITGATSGIGAAFARKFASMGHDLVLTGRREQKIREISLKLSSDYSINVEVIIAELSDPAGIEKVVKRAAELDNLEILVNNAGYGNTLSFEEDSIENQLRMVTVNDSVPARLAHAVIPGMIRRGGGAIINVSSLAGFIPSPDGVLYGSTKAFLNVFSESLHIILNKYGIKVQALCPGFTRTDFHEKLGYEKGELKNRGLMIWKTAESVVRASYRSLLKNKPVCIPGFLYKFLYLVIKLTPLRWMIYFMTLREKK